MTTPDTSPPPGPAPAIAGLGLVASVLSPLLLGAGWLLLPRPDGSALDQLADVDSALARWTAAWLLLLGGALLAVPAAWALASLCPRPWTTGVRVGAVLATLGAMGFMALIAVRGLHGAQLARDLGEPGLDDGLVASWDGLQSGLLRPFVYTPELLAVGVLMVAIGLTKTARTRRAGWTVATGAIVIIGGLFVSQTVAAGVGALIILAGSADLVRGARG